jgi:hypothetical protein
VRLGFGELGFDSREEEKGVKAGRSVWGGGGQRLCMYG